MTPDRTNSSPYSWAKKQGRDDKAAAKTGSGWVVITASSLTPRRSGGGSQPPDLGLAFSFCHGRLNLDSAGSLTRYLSRDRLPHSLTPGLSHNLRPPSRTLPNGLVAPPLPICGAAGGGLSRMAVNQSHTRAVSPHLHWRKVPERKPVELSEGGEARELAVHKLPQPVRDFPPFLRSQCVALPRLLELALPRGCSGCECGGGGIGVHARVKGTCPGSGAVCCLRKSWKCSGRKGSHTDPRGSAVLLGVSYLVE